MQRERISNNNVKSIIIKFQSPEVTLTSQSTISKPKGINKSIYPLYSIYSRHSFMLSFFLSLPSISMVSLTALTNSFPLLYTLLGIFCLLLFEIFVLVLHKKQFYLLQQMQIFKFFISPLLLLTTINMTKTQKLLSIQGSLISLVLCLFSALMSQFLIFQNFKLYSIKSQGLYIVTEWLSFYILLVSITSIVNKSSLLVMSFLLLLIACNNYYKHFGQITNHSLQNKILYIITLLQLNISSLLVIHLIFDLNSLSHTFTVSSLSLWSTYGQRKAILRTLYKEQHDLSNNYPFYLQQIQKNLVEFQANTNEYDFISNLYGNVSANQIISCNSLQNGILRSGIASSLNYLNQQLKKVYLATMNNPSQLLSLLQLQYKFVTLIMQKMQDKMREMLTNYIQNYKWLFQSLSLSVVSLLVLYSLYLYYFPLKSIQNQIKFTSGMIALMPQSSMGQKIMKIMTVSKRI